MNRGRPPCPLGWHPGEQEERVKARRNGRFRWAALAAAIAVIAGTGGALAAYPDSNVAHYAGCMNTHGSAAGALSQLAVGDTPAKACGSNQTGGPPLSWTRGG
jgi:hypothetical protein